DIDLLVLDDMGAKIFMLTDSILSYSF
ncbi:hypothetical protein B966_01646, partial [Staphylococcus aureus M0493]